MKWTRKSIKAHLWELYPDGQVKALRAKEGRMTDAIYTHFESFAACLQYCGMTNANHNSKAIYCKDLPSRPPIIDGLRIQALPAMIQMMGEKHPNLDPLTNVTLAMEVLRSGEYDEIILNSLKTRLNHAV
jgi:hypothetical protein